MRSPELRSGSHLLTGFGVETTFHLVGWTRPDAESFFVRMSPPGMPPCRIYHHCGWQLHCHEYHEIVAVVHGEIDHIVNDERTRLWAGDLIFMRAHDAHRFEPVQATSAEVTNLAFLPEFLDDLVAYLGCSDLRRQFLGLAAPHSVRLPGLEVERIALQFMAIHRRERQPDPRGRAEAKALLAQLLTRYLPTRASAEPLSRVPRWLDDLCKGMNDPHTLHDGLRTMQARAPCTPEHLCKCFRKYFGKTPTQFINELRVQHAARKLTYSDDTVCAISQDVGFKSVAQFYKVFHSIYRRTPNDYRKSSVVP